MSKSRPSYGPLRRDGSGRRHLLVTQGAGCTLPPDSGFADAPPETWAVQPDSGGAALSFPSIFALFDALERRLTEETMGLRLYVQGSEAFLWDVFGLAQAAGLGRREVMLSHVGERVRRVFCVHCSTMNEDVASTLVACAGCGARLAVRDHFSRRLSAFIGVQADAEAPGELPTAEALAS